MSPSESPLEAWFSSRMYLHVSTARVMSDAIAVSNLTDDRDFPAALACFTPFLLRYVSIWPCNRRSLLASVSPLQRNHYWWYNIIITGTYCLTTVILTLFVPPVIVFFCLVAELTDLRIGSATVFILRTEGSSRKSRTRSVLLGKIEILIAEQRLLHLTYT